MITVQILINGKALIVRSAVNTGPSNLDPSGDLHRYEVDDGRWLAHRRSEGAVKLAMMMLEGIRDPGRKKESDA